jgi:hypothetical protein
MTKVKMTKVKINTTLVKEILSIVDKGLTGGLGIRIPGQMCVEAVICHVCGEPHGDNPECVPRYLSSIKISINDDGPWKSNIDRANVLRKLSVLQLGTADTLNEVEFLSAFLLELVNSRFSFVNATKIDREFAEYIAFVCGSTQYRNLDKFAGITKNLIDMIQDFEEYALVTREDWLWYIERLEKVLIKFNTPGAKLWKRLPLKLRNKKLRTKKTNTLDSYDRWTSSPSNP